MTRYISARQLAERYGVNTSTIWRWTKRKKLPQPVQLSEGITRWDVDLVEQSDAERGAAGYAPDGQTKRAAKAAVEKRAAKRERSQRLR